MEATVVDEKPKNDTRTEPEHDDKPKNDTQTEEEDNTEAGTKGSQSSEGESGGVPDGGWGWVVTFAAFIIDFLVGTAKHSFGVLFSHHLNDVGAGARTTSLVYNLAYVLSCLATFFLAPVLQQFGWRRVTGLAGFLFAAGMAMAAFSVSAEDMFFTFTIISGVNIMLLTSIVYTIIPHYFSTKATLATGLMTSGFPLGQLILPLVITVLYQEYGFRGSTLITSGLLLHVCPAAMVFHPVHWHSKRPSRNAKEVKAIIATTETTRQQETPPNRAPHCIAGMVKEVIELQGTKAHNPLNQISSSSTKELITCTKSTLPEATWDNGNTYGTSVRKRETDEEPYQASSFQHDMSKKMDINYGNNNVTNGTSTNKLDTTAKETQVDKSAKLSTLHIIAKTACQNFLHLKSPSVVLISLITSMNFFALVNIGSVVPFAMLADGFTVEDAALCLSVSGACNLLSKPIWALLTYCTSIKYQTLYCIGTLLSAVTLLTFSEASSVLWRAVILGVCGVGSSAVVSLTALLVMELVGMARLVPVYTITIFMHAFVILIMGALLGSVNDLTGSYRVSLWFLGGSLLLTLVLWMIFPAARAFDRRREVTHEDPLPPGKHQGQIRDHEGQITDNQHKARYQAIPDKTWLLNTLKPSVRRNYETLK